MESQTRTLEWAAVSFSIFRLTSCFDVVKLVFRPEIVWTWPLILMLTMFTREILRSYFEVKSKRTCHKNCLFFSLENGALLEALLLELPWWLRWWRICLPMQENWVLSLGWEDPLEKGMETHSSILAWKILLAEEPGRLQFTGSPRVIPDWDTSSLDYCFRRKIRQVWKIEVKPSENQVVNVTSVWGS